MCRGCLWASPTLVDTENPAFFVCTTFSSALSGGEKYCFNNPLRSASSKDTEIQELRAKLNAIEVEQKLAIVEAVNAVEKERPVSLFCRWIRAVADRNRESAELSSSTPLHQV